MMAARRKSQNAAGRAPNSSKPLVGALAVYLLLLLITVSMIMAMDSASWVLVLGLWAACLLFSARRLKQRISLTLFLLSFGLFLLARPLLQIVIPEASIVDFSQEVTTHVQVTLIIGMGAIVGAYLFADRFRAPQTHRELDLNIAQMASSRTRRVNGIALAIYVVTWMPTALSSWNLLGLSSAAGYTSIYTVEARAGSGVFGTILNYSEQANFAALMIFLASTYSKRRTVWVLVAAFIPEVIAMLAGTRGGFGSLVLAGLAYAAYRIRDGRPEFRLSRIEIGAIITAVLLLPLVFVSVAKSRSLDVVDTIESFGGVGNFLYSQGVSITVLSNSFIYQDHIPDQPYLFEFILRGPLRDIFGVLVTSGNSIINATEGASFGHALSYVLMGDAYLAGRGTGSSFLAEAFFTHGYVGVLVVSVLFGFILHWIDRFGASVPRDAVRLILLPGLMLAPRAGASQFLTLLVSPVTIAVFIVIATAIAVQPQQEKVHALT